MNILNSPAFNAFKTQQYNKVMHHEQLHKSAAPSFTGSIVIDKDQNGVATGGHVDVFVPQNVDQSNPEKTKEAARQIENSATAPGSDMSNADKNVAQEAQNLEKEADKQISENKTAETASANANTTSAATNPIAAAYNQVPPAGQKLNVVA